MIASSGVFLLYTAVVAPIQLFLWNYDDPCNIFPTLYLDLVVDLFFLVDPLHAGRTVPHFVRSCTRQRSFASTCECAESHAFASGHVHPIPLSIRCSAIRMRDRHLSSRPCRCDFPGRNARTLQHSAFHRREEAAGES